MNELHQYINNMFYALPKNDEVQQIKENITQSMEEKYRTLRQEGKTVSEAYYIVTSEFGSIEELCKDLDIEPELQTNVNESTIAYSSLANEKLSEEYNVFRKKFAMWISVGVAVIILSFVSQLLLDGYFNAPDAIANSTFLGIAAIGVGICTYWGIQSGKYEVLEPKDVRRKSNLADKLSSIIMCSATIFFLVSGFVYGNWHPAWIVFPIGAIVCGILDTLLSRD